MGCAGGPVCIAVVVVIDWNNNLNPGHLLTPEGREEFHRNLQSALDCVSISWVAGFYIRKSINSAILAQLGFAGSVSTEASTEQAAGLSKAVSTLANIHSPGFPGTDSLQNGHVHASYHNP